MERGGQIVVAFGVCKENGERVWVEMGEDQESVCITARDSREASLCRDT